MAKISLDISLKSNNESSQRKLFGEKTENVISYYDLGYDIDLVFETEKIMLTKQNKDYKITINLAKNNSSCYYEDLKSNLGLKLRISDEEAIVEEGYIYLKYLLENTNRVEYIMRYEVQNEKADN